MNIVDKFWSRVAKTSSIDDCWEWQAGRSSRYGYFFIPPRNQLAHRVSWMFTYGDIPEGMCVCHKCDNVFCVNPNHLFLGTQTDNMRDMKSKGRERKARGEKAGSSKLTEDQVRLIKEMKFVERRKNREIAQAFGVHQSTVERIVYGRTWTHLKV